MPVSSYGCRGNRTQDTSHTNSFDLSSLCDPTMQELCACALHQSNNQVETSDALGNSIWGGTEKTWEGVASQRLRMATGLFTVLMLHAGDAAPMCACGTDFLVGSTPGVSLVFCSSTLAVPCICSTTCPSRSKSIFFILLHRDGAGHCFLCVGAGQPWHQIPAGRRWARVAVKTITSPVLRWP